MDAKSKPSCPHGFDQPTMMLGDRRFENFFQVGLEMHTRTLFVGLAQRAVTDDIGDQDGCKVALHIRPLTERNALL